MGSIRYSKVTGGFFLDFRHENKRYREYTALQDTTSNRKKLQKILDRIESEIEAGTFDYSAYFPNSKALLRSAGKAQDVVRPASSKGDAGGLPVVLGEGATKPTPETATPVFKDFAHQWFEERQIEWRRSHIRSIQSTLQSRILPWMGEKVVSNIGKSDILAFRTELAKAPGRGNKTGLSSKRINEIIGLLCQILNEAADRFEFTPSTRNLKRLRVPKPDVLPFTLQEVQEILRVARPDYRNYFIARFLTGMRTGEVHGLKWEYVDFDLRIIRIRETFVLGESDYTKTDGGQRDIHMSGPVEEALRQQQQVTARNSPYVFCNLQGKPLDNDNFTDRIWYPLLRHLGLKPRKPYQMRHTAATLWLASGEAPEWIARQLGHTDTQMLFKRYSRYIPNLTRQDGSAMERLLAAKLDQDAWHVRTTPIAIEVLSLKKALPLPNRRGRQVLVGETIDAQVTCNPRPPSSDEAVPLLAMPIQIHPNPQKLEPEQPRGHPVH